MNDQNSPCDLLKMNDSDYWRWMIKIIHRFIDDEWWRWMIKIIEDEWFKLLQDEWLRLFIKFICVDTIDEWLKLLKMNDEKYP